jgi:hypothetical protein
MHATETPTQLHAKSCRNSKTGQAPEIRCYGRAHLVWGGIDAGLNVMDQQRVVDRQAERHVMKQAPGRNLAVIVLHGVALYVRHPDFDVPKAIGPAVAATNHLTCVNRSPWLGR